MDAAAHRKALSIIEFPRGKIWSEIRRKRTAYLLDWKRAARFSISQDGRTIRRFKRPGASDVSLRVLDRLARAYAGSLAGRESLHATTLGLDGEAVAFLGPSGEGKSTLAAALIRRGWALLSDDVLPFRAGRSGVLVSPAGGELKLSHRALRVLGRSGPRGEFDPNLRKWIVRFPSPDRRYELKAAILLSRGSRRAPRLRRLRGAQAALVIQSSFYNEVLRPRRVLRKQFSAAAELAGRMPVWRLRYPSGLRMLPRLARRVESCVREPALREKPAAAR